MNRDETIALWKKCEEARAAAIADGQSVEVAHEAAKNIWNTWAEDRLAEREVLKGEGRWKARKYTDRLMYNAYGEREFGENAESKKWLKEAFCDFSELIFKESGPENQGSETEIIKKTERDFGGLRHSDHYVLNFEGFIFPSDCDFWLSSFLVPVTFSRCVFHGFAGFRKTRFANIVLFNETIFHQAAWFARTLFMSVADYDEAVFMGWARFAGAQFEDPGIFSNTHFKDGAWFRGCKFSAMALFDSARFEGEADFVATSVEHYFDLRHSVFTEVPAFNQVDFKRAPDFDGVKFSLPVFWRNGQASLVPAYRALRRVAIQGADYEREQMAFKGEIRSKRGTEHRWYHAALWYGLAYDVLSDFGRSMSRPSIIWLVSIGVFAFLYLADSSKLGNAFANCNAAAAPNYESALIISWKNALPFIGIDSKADEIARSCLYEAIAYGGVAIQGFQKVWSAVLMFLFLLAVRNQFRIR
jgi:hypothetical protein